MIVQIENKKVLCTILGLSCESNIFSTFAAKKKMLPSELFKLKSQGDTVIFIDIRESYEYEFQNIDAKHIPMGEILNRLDEIPRDELVVLHCQSGSRAGKMVDVLRHLGYTKVENLEGGIEAYLAYQNSTVSE